MIIISDIAKTEILWWIENLHCCNGRSIKVPPIDLQIFTDASLSGWGSHCSSDFVHGIWSEDEKMEHINVLELKAILNAVKHFAMKYICKHICIHSDNSGAIAYVENLGGIRSKSLNNLAKELWLWCTAKCIYISAVHVSGVENFSADMLSRVSNVRTEWSLREDIFTMILLSFPDMEIDLFASRFNAKLDKFVSWGLDPMAFAVDAFSLSWSDIFSYPFPSFFSY